MVERELALVVVLKENGSDGFNATRERARAVQGWDELGAGLQDGAAADPGEECRERGRSEKQRVDEATCDRELGRLGKKHGRLGKKHGRHRRRSGATRSSKGRPWRVPGWRRRRQEVSGEVNSGGGTNLAG